MIRLIHLKNIPIFQQLQLEEALLRVGSHNYCIINEGSSPAVVLGSSCKPALHVNEDLQKTHPIPVIKRFSGGGSVVVDEKTLFISFIFNKEEHSVKAFPEPILRWTEKLYQRAWDIEGFHLQANDYAIHYQKCGGNAQYIQKNRWLHHTTFLWDYNEDNMGYLQHPPTEPTYRNNRSHKEFLCRLKEHKTSMSSLVDSLKLELSKKWRIEEISLKDTQQALMKEHRKTTCYIK